MKKRHFINVILKSTICGWPLTDTEVKVYKKTEARYINCGKCISFGSHWPKE
jgi:hypothetical protein|tara:strand:- start:230 stop:385 length:156 start_codon:yes stop_codon:yes gene_type:complete